MIPSKSEVHVDGRVLASDAYSYVNQVHKMMMDVYNTVMGEESEVRTESFFIDEEYPTKHDRMVFSIIPKNQDMNRIEVEVIITKEEGVNVFTDEKVPNEVVLKRVNAVSKFVEAHGLSIQEVVPHWWCFDAFESDAGFVEGLLHISRIMKVKYSTLRKQVYEDLEKM